MQARAFTTGQSVVIPANVGSLDSGKGEALLAHELTHVAQRVRFGPNSPDESTPAGRVLESDARAAEMVFDGGPSIRAMPSSAPRPSTWAAALADPAAGSDSAPPLPLAAPVPAGPDIGRAARRPFSTVSLCPLPRPQVRETPSNSLRRRGRWVPHRWARRLHPRWLAPGYSGRRQKLPHRSRSPHSGPHLRSTSR